MDVNRVCVTHTDTVKHQLITVAHKVLIFMLCNNTITLSIKFWTILFPAIFDCAGINLVRGSKFHCRWFIQILVWSHLLGGSHLDQSHVSSHVTSLCSAMVMSVVQDLLPQQRRSSDTSPESSFFRVKQILKFIDGGWLSQLSVGESSSIRI